MSALQKIQPRFAPVCPAHIAQDLTKADLETFGNYHLLLAHDVLDNQALYKSVYAQLPNYDESVIIMDNSAVELPEPLNARLVLEAAHVVNARVVVLPDALMDCNTTIDMTCQGLRDMHANNGSRGMEFMAVPQGATWDEWLRCLDAFSLLEDLGWIGVAKNINEKLGISRKDAIDAVNMQMPDAKIHLLGFSDNIFDDMQSARHGYNVYGIDSAVPIRIGMRENQELLLGGQEISKRGDWWDDPGTNITQAFENLVHVKFWINLHGKV